MAKKKATGRQEIQKKLSGKLEARYEKRRAAVDAVRAGEPIAVVARVIKVSPRALFKWLERYRHGGYHPRNSRNFRA
jgi:transposase-like protein